MLIVKKTYRLFYIIYICFKYHLPFMALQNRDSILLKILLLLAPTNYNEQIQHERGCKIRQALESLGPIFVKFGQLMSTRIDLLPDDIAIELIKLQDNVPPFASDKAIKIIEKSLQNKIENLFLSFDKIPLASASIAQVHSAKSLDNKDIIVKILRPNIEKIIARDLSLLEALAYLIEKFSISSRRYRPKDVVTEFRKTIMDELDLMKEAANASQLKRNFESSPILYVPEINWDLTRKNVLVMERIFGVCITNIELLNQKQTDLKLLAERGVEIFLTQVFRDCFFHADMHPGNIFISIEDPQNPIYMAIDFGIMGSLSPNDKRYIADNLLAFFKRNYRRVAELHVESGWVPPNTRIDEFESAIRTVCEPIFERPLKDISFGKTLLRLFHTAQRFNMEVQPQLMLLQKTLISVEGVGRQIYPELDLWNTAKPFLENWMKQQMGPKAFMDKLKLNGPFWLEKLPDIPNLLYQALTLSINNQETIKERQMGTYSSLYLKKVKRQGFIKGLGSTFFLTGISLLFFKTTFSFVMIHHTLLCTLTLCIAACCYLITLNREP
ncbi:MAG: ubiB [Francisellaceae bacterium]|nr:ubiB [Francisellaceae bacterium]